MHLEPCKIGDMAVYKPERVMWVSAKMPSLWKSFYCVWWFFSVIIIPMKDYYFNIRERVEIHFASY